MKGRPAAAQRGDVYYAIPKGALALRHDPAGRAKPRPMVILGEDAQQEAICEPITAQHTGGAYVEYDKPGSPSVSYRPGLLCSVLSSEDRTVITPSWGRARAEGFRNSLPMLETTLPEHQAERKNDVRFEFWNLWGIDIDDLKVSRRSVVQSEVATIQRLLREVLGLGVPSWFGNGKPLDDKAAKREKGLLGQAEGAAQLRRGDLIEVGLPPDNHRVPFVVISHNALNGVAPNLVVTLRTVDYEEDDEEMESIVPLHHSGNVRENLGHALVGRPLSVDLTLVRGLHVDPRRIKRLGRSLRDHPAILDRINKGLVLCHG